MVQPLCTPGGGFATTPLVVGLLNVKGERTMSFRYKLSGRLAVLGASYMTLALGALSCTNELVDAPLPESTQPAEPTRPQLGTVAVRPGYYAATNGSSGGSGSISSPWSLSTALAGGNGKVRAGDTIWVRGGTYPGSFLSTVEGTSSRPVVIRAYPGERAILDGAGTLRQPEHDSRQR